MTEKNSTRAVKILKLSYLMHKLMSRGKDMRDKDLEALPKTSCMSGRDFMFLGGINNLTIDGDAIKMNEVADTFQVTPAAVSQIVKKFEADGLIERKTYEEDRRSIYLQVSEKGKKLLRVNKERHETMIQGVLNYIGDEDSDNLIRILEKVLVYFEDLNEE